MKKGKLIGLLGILAAGALALSACGSSSKSAAKNKFRDMISTSETDLQRTLELKSIM